MDPEEYMEKFYKEYGVNVKLGIIEDHSNRSRLAKLVRFFSSNSETEQTSLQDYLERMKEKQEVIYFVAGTSRKEVRITSDVVKGEHVTPPPPPPPLLDREKRKGERTRERGGGGEL